MTDQQEEDSMGYPAPAYRGGQRKAPGGFQSPVPVKAPYYGPAAALRRLAPLPYLGAILLIWEVWELYNTWNTWQGWSSSHCNDLGSGTYEWGAGSINCNGSQATIFGPILSSTTFVWGGKEHTPGHTCNYTNDRYARQTGAEAWPSRPLALPLDIPGFYTAHPELAMVPAAFVQPLAPEEIPMLKPWIAPRPIPYWAVPRVRPTDPFRRGPQPDRPTVPRVRPMRTRPPGGPGEPPTRFVPVRRRFTDIFKTRKVTRPRTEVDQDNPWGDPNVFPDTFPIPWDAPQIEINAKGPPTFSTSTHRFAPPPPGVRETKPGATVIWARRAASGLGKMSEAADLIDCMWQGLPRKMQTRKAGPKDGIKRALAKEARRQAPDAKKVSVKGQGGSGGVKTTPQQKLNDLFKGFHAMDWNKAFLKCVENELEDQALGRAGRLASKSRAQADPGALFGPGSGPGL